MRRYETVAILTPDLAVEQVAPIVERVTDIIGQEGGFVAAMDDWGIKKLAYEIKKKTRGHYIYFNYCGTSAAVNEMERFFRIDDRLLKYMTIILDPAADVEAVKKEMADKAANAEKAAQAKPADDDAEEGEGPAEAVDADDDTDEEEEA